MRIFQLLILIGVSATAFAGDVIRATLVVTNAAHFNEATQASVTLNGTDTRLWTNAVTSASTEIKSSTNISNAAYYLLNHLRSHPFSGVETQSTNNGVVLIGAEGDALSLTLSNTWATVTYRTNTIGTSYGVVRIPRTIEGAATQSRIADGLVDYLNQAATNALTETAKVSENLVGIANTQTISGQKTLSNTGNVYSGASLNLGNYLQFGHSALAVDNAGTNFIADFTGVAYRSITATNDINLLQTTNRAAVRSLVLFLYPNGTNRSLTVPATWHALSAVDAFVTNSTIGILSLTVNGTSETNVFYSYKAVP